MNLKNVYFFIYISIFMLLSFKKDSFQEVESTIQLVKDIQQSIAGTPIQLEFSSNNNTLVLFCTNSYATAVLYPEIKANTIVFKIPEHMYNKRGNLVWKLIENSKEISSGNIDIVTSSTKTIMESYAGPPSIIAGGVDYFMLVVSPTDSLDNPEPEHTPVKINYQFKDQIVKNNKEINNLIAWIRIFSYKQSGRIISNSECNGVPSKEMTTEVYPNNPVDFSISYKRVHDFADGNQITTFKTSIIKDQYDNIVSDGTHVNFVINNSENVYLTTNGNTIDGVATAKMLHPYKEENWKVSAYVDGMAESDTISISYGKLFDKFPVSFSKNNRVITIGPLKSFMNQLIPDGYVTKLHIYENSKLIEIKEEPTRKGIATFLLSPDFYPDNKQYSFVIEAAGNRQKYLRKTLK